MKTYDIEKIYSRYHDLKSDDEFVRKINTECKKHYGKPCSNCEFQRWCNFEAVIEDNGLDLPKIIDCFIEFLKDEKLW